MSIGKTSLDVIVIGGGAAGMMAALFAARAGKNVVLLEKNEKLGKKVYITGKGRCNVTNACDREEFLRNVPHNPRFLFSALNELSNQGLMCLLERLGCPLKIERGQRVFPVSDHASDVTRALDNGLHAAGCQVLLHSTVRRILAQGGAVQGVESENGDVFSAPCVIVCTGGVSYPSTGSTGDGYRFAEALGLRVEPPLPSLVPFETSDDWPRRLQGLTLKNVSLSCRKNGKMLYDEQGELLFTHFGISGPLAIEMSSHIAGIPPEMLDVRLDLKPALTREQLSLRLQREFAANGRKQLKTVLPALLPQRMAEQFPALCCISEEKCVSQLIAEERSSLIDHLKTLKISISATRPIAEAIITRGGVSVKEINPKTMESKRVRGLYFAGEMLDVDAHTGGFNLQIAFSTGALAGQSAAS